MQRNALVPMILWLAVPLLAQDRTSPPTGGSTPAANHGLVLTISPDDQPDPGDPVELRRCLAHNPAVACVEFIITLRNDGSETILFWSTSCPREDPEVDDKKPDGQWEPFPRQVLGLLSCTATIGGYGLIQPGKIYVTRGRLAYMSLDTEFHAAADNASGPRTHRGYDLLATTSPFVIRLRRTVVGCITRSVEAKDIPAPSSSDEPDLCVDKTSPTDRLTTLESNELRLGTTPEVDRLVQELVSRDHQPEGSNQHSRRAPSLPNHGLSLTVAADAPAPPGAAPLRPCFVDKPLLACAPFLITLKNQGKKTILASYDTCGWRPYSADYKKPGGAWQPLSMDQRPVVCPGSEQSGWAPISPGKSYVVQTRLAELGVDASNELLVGSGPVTIRVRRAVRGCVTRWPLDGNETFNEPVAGEQCIGSVFPGKPLAILESNEIELTANPVPP